MNNHYHHAIPFAGSHLNGTLTANNTASEAIMTDIGHEFNQLIDYESCVLHGTSTSNANVSTIYQDSQGITYDIDEMIELLYEMNDRLKRLEKYYVGQKLEELLTGDGEDN